MTEQEKQKVIDRVAQVIHKEIGVYGHFLDTKAIAATAIHFSGLFELADAVYDALNTTDDDGSSCVCSLGSYGLKAALKKVIEGSVTNENR